jgi:hypothetical protein
MDSGINNSDITSDARPGLTDFPKVRIPSIYSLLIEQATPFNIIDGFPISNDGEKWTIQFL